MTTNEDYRQLFVVWKSHNQPAASLDRWCKWKPKITEIMALGFEARIAIKLIKYAGTLTLIGAKESLSARFNKRCVPAVGMPSQDRSVTEHARFRQAVIKAEFQWPIDNSLYYEYGIMHRFLEWYPFGTEKTPTLLAQVSWFNDLHRSTKHGLTIVENLRLRPGNFSTDSCV